MKQITKIFQALLGVAALIYTALIATGRLTWRTTRNWWKRRAKWLRCVIATFFIMIPLAMVGLFLYVCYDELYGRCDWGDDSMSKNVCAHYFQDNKYRVYNLYTGKYTTPKLNWISDAQDNDSLAVYAIRNRRGFINVINGEIIIDAEQNDYRKAWVFSEGLAAVLKDDKIGFINEKNEVAIPFQFEYTEDRNMYEHSYLFHNGCCAMANAEGKYGLIDHTGKWVVEPIYDEIWTPQEGGHRIIVNDGKYGVLDSICNVVFPIEYDDINILSDGFILNKEGKKWQVDLSGNIIQPFMYDGTYYLNYPVGYSENGDIQYAFADYLKYEVASSYGIINRITGEAITPAIYSDINMLSQEIFEVQDSESYDWYLIDTEGNVVSTK